MRQLHDASAKFRVSKHLLSEAEARARRDGMSLSELVRRALRHELKVAGSSRGSAG